MELNFVHGLLIWNSAGVIDVEKYWPITEQEATIMLRARTFE
jgi:hypothetical protein